MNAEVYTKNNCPYCVMAKNLLESRNIPFVEIDAVATRETLIERVTTITGFAPKTVPQIFLNGEYIGGYDSLSAYFTEADAKTN